MVETTKSLTKKPGGAGYRTELEGIRGIALLVIMLDHLIEWPTGGFVALDTFFVLSGFLITGLLLRELDTTGTISFAMFYRRRIRRLFPSSSLVLLVTVLAALLIFIGSRAVSTVWDAIWAGLLVANWNFAINGTDYFATSLPQSPLLHFWSLSLEEQFYLFWPALLLAALAIAAAVRRSQRTHRPRVEFTPSGPVPRRPLFIAIAIVFVASLVWGIIQSDLNPAVAYLSTLARCWEIAAGALLCFAVPYFKKLPSWVRPIMAWSGLAAIMVCVFVLTPKLHYPGYWALIPVAGMALIIAAGTGGNSRLYAASNPVSRYLGKIAFTSYLWHWPVFIFMGVLFGKESFIYLAFSIPISFVLSILTTHLIEDPIRTSNWLEPRSKGHRRDRTHERRVRLGWSLAASIAAIAIVVVVVTVPRSADSETLLSIAPSGTPATGVSADTPQAALTKEIYAGLDATKWPDNLNPSLDNVGADLAPQWMKDGCLDTSAANVDKCIYGDPSLTKTAVLLGDSTAISYMPGLQPALNALGYRIHVLTHAQCPSANIQVLGASAGQPAPGFPGVCDDSRQWSMKQVIALNPDLVIMTDGQAELGAMVITGDSKTRLAAFQAGMADTLTKLAPLKSRIVILSAPPQTVSLTDCATRINTPKDCVRPVETDYFGILKANQDAATQVTTLTQKPVQVVDTTQWFCSPQSTCPTFAGTTPIRADELHLTATFSAQLQPILSATFADGSPTT